MKKFSKNSIVSVFIVSFMFVTLGFAGPTAVLAATAPDLGAAANYGVWAKAGVTNTGLGTLTHIWGNVGVDATSSIAGLLAGQVDGVIDVGAGVQSASEAAFLALAGWSASGVKNLNTPQTVTPGVWTLDASQVLTGDITLSGAGVYIFRSDSAYTVANSARVLLTNGADACNVFWRIPSQMVIGTNAQMVGTIITGTELISLNTGATLQGRALAHSQVTLLSNQITEPTCTVTPTPTPTPSGNNYNILTVFKQVINDNGGKATYTDFPLFLNGNSVISGQSQSLAPGTYTLTETNLPGYETTFTGNCNTSGVTTHGGINTHNNICTIVNNDIGTPSVALVPPLIDVVKVPSPLALPAGPGLVTYTYTVKNIGTVPMTDVTMVGDTCSPIVLVSGDTNGDSKLDVSETWVYSCAKTLTQTTINTVVATGHANGLVAVDVTNATVVVGEPIVPPLIHITKVPSPLALPAGAGMVTYTKKVTNPGTVALSNVSVTDDKCSPVSYISGDTNNDSKLDTTETWVYTCRMKVTKTTTNTATAVGSANGLTATDFALATVVVAIPKLPNTGFATTGSNTLWNIIMLAGISAVLILFYFVRRKQTV